MMSFWIVPARSSGSAPCSSATTWYSASSHIAVALIVIEVFISAKRQASNSAPHLTQMRDRHADLADLAAGERRVRVVAGLGRQVEGDRQSGLPLGQVAPIQRVGFRRRTVPGIRSHHPGAIAARILRLQPCQERRPSVRPPHRGVNCLTGTERGLTDPARREASPGLRATRTQPACVYGAA